MKRSVFLNVLFGFSMLLCCSCSDKFEKEIASNANVIEKNRKTIAAQGDTISMLSNTLDGLKAHPRIALYGMDLDLLGFTADINDLPNLKKIRADLIKYYPNCEELPRINEIVEFLEYKVKVKEAYSSLKITHDDFKNMTWYETSKFNNARGSNYVSVYISRKGAPVHYDDLVSFDNENIPHCRFKVNYSGDALYLKAVQLYYLDNGKSRVFSIKPGFFDDSSIDYEIYWLRDSWATLDVQVDDYNGLMAFLNGMIEGTDAKVRLIDENNNYFDRTITDKEMKALEDVLLCYFEMIEWLPEYLKGSINHNSYSLSKFYHDITSFDVYD